MESKRKIVKLLVFVGLALIFAFSLVSQSEAQKSKPLTIKGTYGVVGHDVCVGHWIQNPNPQAVYDTHWTNTTTLQGIVTFTPDGHGSAEVNQVTITHPIYTPIPSASFWAMPIPPTLPYGDTTTTHISSTFTYTISPDRSMRREVTSSGYFTSGAHNGKSIGLSSSIFTGYISLDMGTIIESTPVDSNPAQADYTSVTIMYNADQSIYAIQEQICQRTRVLTLIK